MGYKVFVGNLSFKTRESDLAEEFAAAGKVLSANIITRGPRSLGYGFVELETEEEAQKAVTLLNKKAIDTRQINVELARAREDGSSPEIPKRGRGGFRGGRGGGRGGPSRGRGGFRGRGGAFAPPNEGAAPGSPATSSPANITASSNEGDNNAADDGSSSRGRGGGGRGDRGRRFRARRQRKNDNGPEGSPQPGAPSQNTINRVQSKTTLFVGNVPFSMDDEGLSELFKSSNPKNAYIVKNRNGHSKGFGFVEFANEEDQKAALTVAESLQGERKLSVKIAYTDDRNNPIQPSGSEPTTQTTESSTAKQDANNKDNNNANTNTTSNS